MKALKIGNLLAPVPIVQGGMGVGISLAGLASAVADQGGIGVISSAGLGVIYKDYSKDYRTASIWGLKQELKKAREATKGIVGVNVMVAMSNFADMVRTAIAEKADIIFSGAGLPLNLPSFLTEAMEEALPLLERKLRGYAQPDALLTAMETRSSSPVRILRDESGQSALRGLYPCGEGAGYAGGILSAAADGMRCAEKIWEVYS